MSPNASIALVGLGNMGRPMAHNLARAGHRVVGHDAAPYAREAARADGLSVVDDPVDVAAPVVILMLPNSDVVERVLLEGGLADRIPGGLVIDMSSSDPVRTRALAGELAARGVRLVDAPVSGGVKGAVAGTLTIMAGGAETDLDEAEPILAALGRTTRTGEVGSGHALKALNNLLSGVSLLASSEAIQAGRRFGLSDEVMLQVLNTSSGRSFSTEFKWPTFIVPETYDSGFSLRLLLKDMRIATTLAREVGLPAGVGECAVEYWDAAASMLPETADHTEIATYAATPHSTTDAARRD